MFKITENLAAFYFKSEIVTVQVPSVFTKAIFPRFPIAATIISLNEMSKYLICPISVRNDQQLFELLQIK